MKTLLPFVVVLLVIPLGTSAAKGGKPHAALGATLNLSPSIWVSQDTISVTGSGYKARKPVTIDVAGPVSLTVDTVANSSGGVSVSLPYTEFTPGSYAVSSYQTLGSALTLMAATGFEAQ